MTKDIATPKALQSIAAKAAARPRFSAADEQEIQHSISIALASFEFMMSHANPRTMTPEERDRWLHRESLQREADRRVKIEIERRYPGFTTCKSCRKVRGAV